MLFAFLPIGKRPVQPRELFLVRTVVRVGHHSNRSCRVAHTVSPYTLESETSLSGL